MHPGGRGGAAPLMLAIRVRNMKNNKKMPINNDPDLKIFGLCVWIHGRQFESSVDFWDGNWLRATAICSSEGVTVKYRAQ
jgi:hypothetical protein